MRTTLAGLVDLIEELRRETLEPPDHVEPHPLAGVLRLPDGSLAPDAVRLWAAFDNRYPTYLSRRRSHQQIANDDGEVICSPMHAVLRWVCLESIRGELEDDDETIAYLQELVDGFAEELPGYGVYLEPQENPDRVLWFGPEGRATIIWYEDDAFERRELFEDYVASLFES